MYSVCFLQWAFYRVVRSCCSAEDIEIRSPASASRMKTSPTWTLILLLLQPAAVKSLAASLGVSSNASLSVHQANQKAKPPVPTEEPAHWITDYHCRDRTCVILLLLSEEELNICKNPVFDRLNTPGGLSPVHLRGRIPLQGLSSGEKLLHFQDRSHT